MKTKQFIKNMMARAAMTLLMLITMTQGTWVTDFITDVMLIGGTKTEVNNLKSTYQNQGWTVIDYDLNKGCGSSSDYIYLLYKTADNYSTANLTFISNLYISTSSGTAADNITYDDYDYHLVPYDGGSQFKSKKGDLNSNTKGDAIHLYYTKKNITGSSNYKAISSIVFNTTQSGAVGKNGGTTGYNLNSGAGGDKIYMHVTIEKAHWWVIEKSIDEQQCILKGFESDEEKTNVRTIPVIIEGATVVIIHDMDLAQFGNLEEIYFSTSNDISEMPSVKGCSNFKQVNTVDNSGNVKEYELPPSITSIPDEAFSNTKLKDIKMPNVTSVGKYAFYGCTQLPVTDSIRYADTYLVGAVDKSQSQYTIKTGTRFVGECAFKECKVFTSIDIPNTVTYIGESAFYGCSSMTSIDIPNSVESIGESAFYGCSGLTSVTIPNSVISIGNDAFAYCI